MVKYKNANEFLIDYLNRRTDEDRPLSKHLEIAFEAGRNSNLVEARVSPTEPLTDAQQLALNLLKLPLKLDVMSRYIFDANDNMVAEMRGWGWIQYKPQPELMQDTLAQMFTDAFNIVYKR